VSQIKIYIDEDAMDSDLVAALRSRGVIVITAFDAGLAEKPDEEQLACPTAHECVLYTFNVSDFHRLHTQWISAGREHAGMILAPNSGSRSASNYAASCVFPRPRPLLGGGLAFVEGDANYGPVGGLKPSGLRTLHTKRGLNRTLHVLPG